MPESEASQWGRIGAHLKWGAETDRTAATAAARAKFDQRFLDQADGDPVRAAHLRKAYFGSLALKSAQSRRKAKALTQIAEAAGSEFDALDGGAA